MKKYVCDVCGYVYDEEAGDPDNGIAPGTKWEDVPEDFVCPLCGVGKDQFSEEQSLRDISLSGLCPCLYIPIFYLPSYTNLYNFAEVFHELFLSF